MTVNFSSCGDCARVNRIRVSRLYGTCDGRTVTLNSPACDVFAPLFRIPPDGYPVESSCEPTTRPLFDGVRRQYRSRATRRKP